MEYEYVLTTNSELYHHGTKGMRWGIRRYQNKDGSLTPAGKKRLKAESAALKKEEETLKNQKATKAKFDRLEAKRKSIEDQKKALKGSGDTKKDDDATQTPAKKSVKDMSDNELANEIRRIQMERQYEALTAQPEQINGGKAFVKDFMAKAAIPALQEAGKSLIKDSLLKAGKKYLGLEGENTEDAVDKMAKEVKRMTTIKTYNKLKEEFEAEAAAKKSNSKTNKNESKNDNDDAGKSKTSDKKNTTETKSEKVYEGTVEGGSKRNSKTANQGKQWTKNSTVIDADWYEVVDNSNTSTGRSYVSGLLNSGTSTLGLPAPRDDD